MATIDALSAKYPKYKTMGKFKVMAQTYARESPLVSYYCMLRVADMINGTKNALKTDFIDI